jgi:hypothetical protein
MTLMEGRYAPDILGIVAVAAALLTDCGFPRLISSW